MDSGNTAFVLICTALVLMMTPALAFFYGGLVKAKSVVSMMMLSFGSLALISVLWIVYGYAISFANPGDPGYVGIPGVIGINLGDIGLAGLLDAPPVGGLPPLAFAAFQGTFAIITVALISGAVADRARFGAWLVFAGFWATLVYFPVASWVFNIVRNDNGQIVGGGWLVSNFGLIDFAGGTVVEIASGSAALALAIVLGTRVGFAKGAHKPHNVPLVLLGAGLLWFGWLGFNAGSELAADGIASLALINTIAAPSAGIIGWLIVERLKDGKATSVGAASGAISGAVAITPSCASLTPLWALAVGLIAGVLCALAVELKFRWGFDDSLDVVGIHLVGGLVGTLAIGVVGTGVGLVATGSFSQLGSQALGSVVVMVFSFGMTWIIGTVIDKTMGFRVRNEDELAGIDTYLHGEEGYAIEGR
ncbi:MAG: ammonium transporter [Aurantimicrobium sp.]|nr:ammonium transporter [Aurantimicrobium sp.]